MIPLDAKVYEVLALAMRYFFTAMGLLIVVRAFSWLRKDRKLKHRRLKQLPDAGTIGVLEVLSGGEHLHPGDTISVPHEGVLGYLRTCDVVVPVDGVATTHLDFTFVDGQGLYIYPRRGCEATVDDFALTSRRESRAHPMFHGSVLKVGSAVLRLGVFAGLDVEEVRQGHAQVSEFTPESEWPESPAAWQNPPNWPQPPHPPQNPPRPYPPQVPPYGQPVYPPPYSPPVQPPYAPPVQPAPPQYPPYQPPVNPWQGGDGDAQ